MIDDLLGPVRRPPILSEMTRNWLHLERLRPIDDGRMEDGKFIIQCRTPDDLVVLPEKVCCAAPLLKRNGTKTVRFRHRRMQPMPTWLEVKRQRFQCRTCLKPVYEELPDIHEGHMMTKALEDEVFKATIKRSFDTAAVFHQIKKGTARRIFLENAQAKLKDYEIVFPRVLGVDENHILGTERFVAMDVEAGTVLDMLDGRSVPMLREYFGRMANHFNVEVFCQDMWTGYATIAAEQFRKAIVVIDKFHVIQYANRAMDEARIHLQSKLTNDDRRWLKGKNRLLLMRHDDLEKAKFPNAFDKVAEICERYPEIKEAYTLKERFFWIYEMEDRAKAEAHFEEWDRTMPTHLARFFRSISRRVRNWHVPIFNYYEARYTSGVVERMNRSINDINSGGFGYDFETLRAKVLLRYGNIIPLGDLVAFSPNGTEEEMEALLNTPVVRSGFDPATLLRALKRGTF
ncbi:ISL3 family transposase [Tardiphaga sp. 367_B4_N1_1]|uniref:ISL3 family transposase n=1 Tax=Tardiphaga sp. 367_B4_N1_1 TaxID=3240777 RepID=UPI003F28789E